MGNSFKKVVFLVLLLPQLLFIGIFVVYIGTSQFGFGPVLGRYLPSNYLALAPRQEELSRAIGVRFTGERYRTFDLPRLYKSFDFEQIKNRSQQKRKQNNNCTKWIVFTAIHSPSESVKRSKEIVESQASWCCVVVFDEKSPVDEYKKLQSTKFFLLTVEQQNALAKRAVGYKITEHLPWNNFARQNAGYLYAINQNAEVIFEMDDDNLLLPDDIPIGRKQNGYSYVASPDHVYNPDKDFIKSASSIWPRGFPLDFINANKQMKVKSPGTPCRPSLGKDASIQQFLTNYDPDVDAIYRLTNKLPIYSAESKNRPIVLQTGTLSPFNARATLYLPSAFYGLFLPSTVHERVSDIWRSYFTQRLQWDIGRNIVFTRLPVKQKKSYHDDLADFESEKPLYSKTSALVKFLVHWNSEAKTFVDRMEELTIEFYERGFWELNDVLLMQMWIQDLHELGYQFPKLLQHKRKDCSDIQTTNALMRNTPTKKKNRFINKPHQYKLQLFLRMFSKPFQQQMYTSVLLPSLKLFWQQEVEPINMLVVLDDESARDHAFGKKISQAYPKPKVLYESPQPFYKRGKDRMQWGMFWADNFTDAKYVGFIDTDTMFTTLVTQNLLFEGDKPHIWGVFNKPENPFWANASHGTHHILKKKEVFRAMNYFPVIIKQEHLVQLRKYVGKVHKKSFSLTWRDMPPDVIVVSQFNIMANYVWYFHRDEYIWHMEENHGPGFKVNVTGQTNDFSEISFQMRVPYPRSSVHYKYLSRRQYKIEKKWQPRTFDGIAVSTRNRLLREGYCFSVGFRENPKMCKEFKESNIQKTLFEFEGRTWTWDKRCYVEQKKHYNRAENRTHVWDKSILQMIFDY